MKQYPVYKDLGIEWLREIPKHWEKKKLKIIFKIVNGATPQSSESDYWDGDISWATPDDFSSVRSDGVLNATRRRITISGYQNCGTTIAPQRSIIISTRAPIGYVAVLGKDMCCNQGCRILMKRDCNTSERFYYYFISAFSSVLASFGDGSTFKELSRDKLANFMLVIVPQKEQTVIVTFIDSKVSQIDDLITKKERMIELLKEECEVVINQAVTKGLDSNVEMKDSGVEWLGKVPKHWGIKKLKFVACLKSGDGIDTDLIKGEDQYPVFGGNGIRGYTSAFTHDGNFVLIGRQGALCGNVNYANGRFWASEHAVVVTLNVGYDVIWLGELLRSMNLNQYSQSAAQPGLAVDSIQNLSVPVPPHKEQKEIATFLERRIKQIHEQTSREQESIELLKEYRTALISEVVTGKIDVRN